MRCFSILLVCLMLGCETPGIRVDDFPNYYGRADASTNFAFEKASLPATPLEPDEVKPGDVCPSCHGTGRTGDGISKCQQCDGDGRIDEEDLRETTAGEVVDVILNVQLEEQPEEVERIKWVSDFRTAWDRSKETGKPVLIVYGFKGCRWCEESDVTLFKSPFVIETVNSRFIPYKMDVKSEGYKRLIKQEGYSTLSVKVCPTHLVYWPADNLAFRIGFERLVPKGEKVIDEMDYTLYLTWLLDRKAARMDGQP